ncbi:MAG: TatD family hydrolase [Parachlamydia sp.]|nr:TatD family hydrolase [Parachlamydia sp.]
MTFIDSHAHLTSTVYPQVDVLLARAKEADISAIVNICTDHETLVRGVALRERYPWIYNTAATIPHDVEKEGEAEFDKIAHHARSGDLVAIGETGLDYHYHHSPKDTQQLFLRRYLRLALECKLPVVIHCREAFADFFSILDEEYKIDGRHAPGVLHCFTGTLAEARQVIERDWYLSLSGIVTFKKSEELREVAKIVPLDRLLIETDTPYLAPQSKRGQQNEPAYLPETAACIAPARGISVEQIAQATSENAKRLFGII